MVVGQLSSSSRTIVSAEEKNESPTMPSGVIFENFQHDWYIRVKVQDANTAMKIELIESSVLALLEALKNRLIGYDIQLWHQRLFDGSAKPEPTTYAYYWLIGLPDLPSPDLAVSKKFLREWQKDVVNKFNNLDQKSKTIVQTKFIPKKALLEYDFREDARNSKPHEVIGEIPKRQPIESGETFKKKAGSNPRQVRQQFLQHVMGQESKPESERTTKLRPFKDVLNKLRYDPGYNLDHYVVGYIDRKAGIQEKPASSWGKFREEDLVAYVKNLSEDRVVWDRDAKIDLVFNEPPKLITVSEE